MRIKRLSVLAVSGMLMIGIMSIGNPTQAEAASLNPIIVMENIADSEAKYTIIATMRGYLPEKLIEQFVEHKGEIHIENTGYGTGGGYTTLLLYDDDTISFPTPAHMSINTEGEADQYVDDYVLHEFGHVFDAINGVTNDDLYREIILSEMSAFNEAIAEYYEDKEHFRIPQEMFAELFAAYMDPENVFMAEEKLEAAPNSAKVIEHVLKEKGYKIPDDKISNTYKAIEYGSTEVVKRMDLVPEGYLRSVTINEVTYMYDSRKTDATDEDLLAKLKKECATKSDQTPEYRFITYENKTTTTGSGKTVTLKN